MDRNEIFDILIETFSMIQEMSSREVPELTENTLPIGDLPGFDSLSGLEATIMLPVGLWDGENICTSDNGKKALNIGEITTRILEHNNPSI